MGYRQQISTSLACIIYYNILTLMYGTENLFKLLKKSAYNIMYSLCPIMLTLCSILWHSYFSKNHPGIFRPKPNS